jgi:Family of unknown function (DUF6624)
MRTSGSIALALLFNGVLWGAPTAPPGPTNKPLRLELLGMARDDQQMEGVLTNDASRQLFEGALNTRMHARIQEIVARFGWPGKTLVGEDGAHAAWLIVQHSDENLPFQRQCLELMRLAFKAGEVTPYELSFLTDRVLSNEGLPQMYGTQLVGVLSPADEARVDLNRLALGLEPWRAFIEKRSRNHGPWLPEIKPD